MTSKADLHVHTKYSDRPSEWFLRRVGAPESFTEPMDVYRKCKARGMDFVTISDHNRIDGALDIAHLPDTFISEEATVYFPEDGCKTHILVTGITEAQFKVIDELRTNIYEFQRYVLDKKIIHSVAHPLYSVNNMLDVSHFEKLLLLFNRFEGINGARHPRACDLAMAVCNSLTPADMERLANEHNIEPHGLEPWKKVFTAGSDDHGGQYIASAYTVTPKASSVAEYLELLRRGQHEVGGSGGTSLQLAHSFFHIAYSYYRSRLLKSDAGKGGVIAGVLERLLHRTTLPTAEPSRGIRGRITGAVGGWVMNRKRQRMSEPERLLFDELQALLAERGASDNLAGDALSERETFRIASRISHQISFSLAQKVIDRVQAGDLFESIAAIASLGPVALGVTPYITAMKTQHKDEVLLQKVARHFSIADQEYRGESRAWCTDTYSDVNGVTTTIRQVARVARRQGKPISVITCVNNPLIDDEVNLKNFTPVGEFKLPEYESLNVAFPPFLEMMEYLESQKFSELIISTPGPVGLTALLAAKVLGLRTIGIYHTDFPRYALELTQDQNLEAAAWRYMQWFYEQVDTILAPSECYRRTLIENGLSKEKIQIFGRGVDTARFHPDLRTPGFWKRYGLAEGFTFVYVGRLSAEKNVEALLAAFTQLASQRDDVRLAVVGDGPQYQALRQRYRHPAIAFTGFLHGEELGRAYASSDAFVFPSTTDTFGNVVLEALASGLLVVAYDTGAAAQHIDVFPELVANFRNAT